MSRAMDYAHARHAGNAGDVFKHVALLALMESLPGVGGAPLTFVESHAGDGLYPLGSVGEWTAGIERLWTAPAASLEAGEGGALVRRYLDRVRHFSPPQAGRPRIYPGSPALVRQGLGPRDRLVLHDLDARALTLLQRSFPGDERVQVRGEDGLEALGGALAAALSAGRAAALVDPPYVDKMEWTLTERALVAARERAPAAPVLVWYPIKALTRPRALLAQLAKAGVRGTAVELITTPLRLQREKLNGSGMLFLGAPASAVQATCAALPVLGPLLATHGEWSANQIGF